MKTIHAGIAALLFLPVSGFAQTPAGPPGFVLPVPTAVEVLLATNLDFGNVIYGANPVTKRITLANDGTARMEIQRISISGDPDFTTTNTCGNQLWAGGRCDVTINFAPRAMGTRSAKLSIHSNAPQDHSVQLTGKGCRYHSPETERYFLTSC